MKTVCHNQLSFESLFSKEVIGDFEGGRMSSDAGSLLLRELDRQYSLSSTIAASLRDERAQEKITHELEDIVAQRIISIALGYEDTNDAASLRKDPALKISVGHLPESSPELASQPTLSRFENAADSKDLRRLSDKLFELYVRTHERQRGLIIIDIDSTDDPTHGAQQLSMFHGYFDQHMYHPLLVFDGQTGFPLAAVLRPGNAGAARGAAAILKRIIRKLKRTYPGSSILLRADAGFAAPAIYELCEREGLYYTIGLITNERLKARVAGLVKQAQNDFAATGHKQRLFTSFAYQAEPWDRHRLVAAKVECMPQGTNQRFVVTNSPQLASKLYDGVYVLRGETENRIKELKRHLKADRLSCHEFKANQFRLLLHSFAYVLLWLLRRHLEGTCLASAQADTLRLKLLKVAARIVETTRKVWVHFASEYPYRHLFATVLDSIRAAPA